MRKYVNVSLLSMPAFWYGSLWILLNLLDAQLSIWAWDRGLPESNPLWWVFMDKSGAVIVVKLLLSGAALLGIMVYTKGKAKWLPGMVTGIATIVVWNIMVLLTQT